MWDMWKKYSKYSLGALLVIALGLRIAGINYGLPSYRLLADEEWHIEKIYKLNSHNLNPRLPGYPTFFSYLILAISKIFALFKITLSNADYYLLGRIISCIFGVATIVITYKLGKLLRGKSIAILSAAFITFNPLHIQFSHIAVTDATLAFWITLAVFTILKFHEEKIGILWQAVCIGLAVSTKYSGIAAITPLLIVFCLDKNLFLKRPTKTMRVSFQILLLGAILGLVFIIWHYPPQKIINFSISISEDGHLESFYRDFINKIPRLLLYCIVIILGSFLISLKDNKAGRTVINYCMNKKLFLSLCIIALTFFIVFPFAILDFKYSLKGFFFQYFHQAIGGASCLPEATPFYKLFSEEAKRQPWSGYFYIKSIVKGFGAPALGLAIFGMIRYLLNDFKRGIILLSFPAAAFLIASSPRYLAQRYMLPVVPFLCISAGIGTALFLEYFKKWALRWNFSKRICKVFAVCFIVFVFSHPIEEGIRQARYFILPNTQVLAAQWIKENISGDLIIASEIAIPERNNVKLLQCPLTAYTIEDLKKENIRVLVTIDPEYYGKVYRRAYPTTTHRYLYLQKKTPLREFVPDSKTSGPEIYIYSIE